MGSSKHRDSKVVATVACPTCGAPAGQLCRGRLSHQPVITHGHAIIHPERRRAWQEAKGGPGTPSEPGAPRR